MKVCFINPFGYPLLFPDDGAPAEFGGAEVQLSYLAAELAKDPRYAVTTLVESERELVRAASPGATGVQTVRPLSRAARAVRARVPLPSRNYLRAFARADADVYVQRGGAVLTGDVALFCALNRRAFVFMTAHQWDCDGTHRRGDPLCGRYYEFGLRRADAVVSQSADHRRLLIEHYGIESTVFDIVYPDACEEPDAPRRTVLWVGRSLAWKRPELFLELARGFPQAEFVMVCPREGGDARVHEEMQRRSAAHPNVVFTGRVSFARIDEYFREALVYVNTSVAEGFPNTFVQAARSGTPIVSLNVDPDGVLERENIGFACGGDLRTAAGRLRLLLGDDAERARRSDAGRRYFRARHLAGARIGEFAGVLRAVRG